MKEIQKGLYEVEGQQMPCSAADIRIGLYVLPGTLDRMEREEAATRILRFSKELDQWVGVSWGRLLEQMQEEVDEQQAHQEKVEQHYVVADELRKYRFRNFLTFGLYSHFAEKPVVLEVPEYNAPFTGIFLWGVNHVVTGIHELIEAGMLRLETKEGSENEEALDVFFPTPSLIQRIMQKQNIVPA